MKDSLSFHSLDEDHNNWDPANKVPVHHSCHRRYHTTGDKNPSKLPGVGAKISKALTGRPRPDMAGDKNPNKRPEVAAKISKALKGRLHTEEHNQNISKAMKGRKLSEQHRQNISEVRRGENGAAKRGWKTRYERYGPTGRRPRPQINLNHNQEEVNSESV